jgi:hypothetical protein
MTQSAILVAIKNCLNYKAKLPPCFSNDSGSGNHRPSLAKQSSQHQNHEEDKSMPINLKRTFILAALVTVLIGSGAAKADVKVGFLGGFTGPLKSMTPSVYKAAKLAVKNVNDQGGVLDGQKIIPSRTSMIRAVYLTGKKSSCRTRIRPVRIPLPRRKLPTVW